MDNKEFSRKLEIRSKNFAVQIIRFSISLPSISEGKVVINQLTKSGSCIGANYREANRARSKADFKNKIKICESEANETAYWLEISKDLNWGDSDELESAMTEANELLAIFTSIGKNL
jgi:four helix bundle protein